MGLQMSDKQWPYHIVSKRITDNSAIYFICYKNEIIAKCTKSGYIHASQMVIKMNEEKYE